MGDKTLTDFPHHISVKEHTNSQTIVATLLFCKRRQSLIRIFA